MRRIPAALLVDLSALASGASDQDPPLRQTYPKDYFPVLEASVPMRDGAKLHTLILTRKRCPMMIPS